MNKGIGYYLSPIGLIKIVEESGFLVQVRFVKIVDEIASETPLILRAIEQLNEYFHKTRKQFDLPIKLFGTAFQQKVYAGLQKIPYGTSMSYQDVAVMIGHPNAYRAVGNANNQNNLFLVVPCHRVTTKSGNLSGAKEWTKMQQWLLEFEQSFF